jgi:hypothetical protein
MRTGIYLGVAVAVLGCVGIAHHPEFIKDVESVVQSHWGLISAILLSSFLWKFVLRRVVQSTPGGIQHSKSRK